MTQRPATSAETQQRIYHEARRLFNLKGYVGMTLREVARGVGIEAQSLYNYTPSKQDLVVSLMSEGTVEIQQAVDGSIAGASDDPGDRLWAATWAHVFHYCTSDKVLLVRDGLVHLDDERRTDVMGLLKDYEDTFKGLLRAGMASGQFLPLDPTPTAFAIIGMGESVVNWFSPGRRLTADDVAKTYADMALRSVVAGHPINRPSMEET